MNLDIRRKILLNFREELVDSIRDVDCVGIRLFLYHYQQGRLAIQANPSVYVFEGVLNISDLLEVDRFALECPNNRVPYLTNTRIFPWYANYIVCYSEL